MLKLTSRLGVAAGVAVLAGAATVDGAIIGEAVLASATDPVGDRRDIVVLEQGGTALNAAYVRDGQANPFGEPVLNPQSGLAVQVTAGNLISGTPGFGQQVEWLWGSATGGTGDSIDGPILGAASSVAPSIGFANDGSVFLEVANPEGVSANPAEVQRRDGSTVTTLTVGDSLAGGTLSLIGAVRSDDAGQVTLTARINDGGATDRPGLYYQPSGSAFAAIVEAGDAISGVAGATIARNEAASGGGLQTATFANEYAVVDASTYIVEAGIDTTGDGIAEGMGIVVSGAIATADGLPLLAGEPVAGGRTNVEVVISGDVSDNDPPVVTEFRDERWDFFRSSDINAGGQWILSAVSNLDATAPDDTPINGNYLVRNGSIDTTVVDPLDSAQADRDLEAVAINDDGDFAFVYGEALYINNVLVLDTNGNSDFQIAVENMAGGTDAVTLDRLLALGNALALTDRDANDQVIAYLAAADNADLSGSLQDNKYLVAVPYVIPEPTALAILGLGCIALATGRRRPSQHSATAASVSID